MEKFLFMFYAVILMLLSGLHIILTPFTFINAIIALSALSAGVFMAWLSTEFD